MKKAGYGVRRVGAPTKCPGSGRPSTRGRKQRYRGGGGKSGFGSARGKSGIFWPGLAIIPDKTLLFPRISRAPRGHYDDGRRSRIAKLITLEGWLAPNGYVPSRRTCRHSWHPVRVGFVVATTTMR